MVGPAFSLSHFNYSSQTGIRSAPPSERRASPAYEAAEKARSLSSRGGFSPRNLSVYWTLIQERFLAALGMTINSVFPQPLTSAVHRALRFLTGKEGRGTFPSCSERSRTVKRSHVVSPRAAAAPRDVVAEMEDGVEEVFEEELEERGPSLAKRIRGLRVRAVGAASRLVRCCDCVPWRLQNSPRNFPASRSKNSERAGRKRGLRIGRPAHPPRTGEINLFNLLIFLLRPASAGSTLASIPTGNERESINLPE